MLRIQLIVICMIVAGCDWYEDPGQPFYPSVPSDGRSVGRSIEQPFRIEAAADSGASPAIIYNVINQTSGSIFLGSSCSNIFHVIERLDNNEWRPAYSNQTAAGCQPIPIELLPGNRLSGSHLITQSGRYRVVVWFRHDTERTIRNWDYDQEHVVSSPVYILYRKE